MGLVYADLRLGNPAKPQFDQIDARALVDSGAVLLCIPEHIRRQLGLDPVEQREIWTAAGKLHMVDYVGPLTVEMFGRHSFTGALVLGDQVLLGAIPMEDMDLVIEPLRQRVIPNPEHPDIPFSIVMDVRP